MSHSKRKKYYAYNLKLTVPIYWIRQGQPINLIVSKNSFSLNEANNYFHDLSNQQEIENGIRIGKYQLGDISEYCYQHFVTCINSFEQYICDFSYKTYDVWKCGTAYIINNSIIIYVSIKIENQQQFVIEEIFNDGSLNIDFKVLEKNSPGILYWKFSGLGYCNSHRTSNYLLINNLFPQFRIDDLYNKWIGFPISFVTFRLYENGYYGYAISKTNSKRSIKEIIDRGSDLLFACLSCSKLDSFMHGYGMKFHFSFDNAMHEILTGRLHGKYDISWIKHNLGGNKYGLEENGMMFCWLTIYTKNISDNIEETILKNLQNKIYDDIKWYEYTLPENKWKSEQLVYELVKQLFPKKSVFYQYRPEFLHYNKNRQLSYDIFIPSEKIAFEYQGRQHFEPIDFFGGEQSYKKQIERDELKRKLSKEYGITLVYINYWDKVSPDLIKKRIEEARKNLNYP